MSGPSAIGPSPAPANDLNSSNDLNVQKNVLAQDAYKYAEELEGRLMDVLSGDADQALAAVDALKLLKKQIPSIEDKSSLDKARDEINRLYGRVKMLANKNPALANKEIILDEREYPAGLKTLKPELMQKGIRADLTVKRLKDGFFLVRVGVLQGRTYFVKVHNSDTTQDVIDFMAYLQKGEIAYRELEFQARFNTRLREEIAQKSLTLSNPELKEGQWGYPVQIYNPDKQVGWLPSANFYNIPIFRQSLDPVKEEISRSRRKRAKPTFLDSYNFSLAYDVGNIEVQGAWNKNLLRTETYASTRPQIPCVCSEECLTLLDQACDNLPLDCVTCATCLEEGGSGSDEPAPAPAPAGEAGGGLDLSLPFDQYWGNRNRVSARFLANIFAYKDLGQYLAGVEFGAAVIDTINMDLKTHDYLGVYSFNLVIGWRTPVRLSDNWALPLEIAMGAGPSVGYGYLEAPSTDYEGLKVHGKWGVNWSMDFSLLEFRGRVGEGNDALGANLFVHMEYVALGLKEHGVSEITYSTFSGKPPLGVAFGLRFFWAREMEIDQPIPQNQPPALAVEGADPEKALKKQIKVLKDELARRPSQPIITQEIVEKLDIKDIQATNLEFETDHPDEPELQGLERAEVSNLKGDETSAEVERFKKIGSESGLDKIMKGGNWKKIPAIALRVRKFLKTNPNLGLTITGHTDSTAPSEYNLGLSKRRAEAIKQVFVRFFGLPADRIKTYGFGEDLPFVNEAAWSKEDQVDVQGANRRTEFGIFVMEKE